MMSRSHSPSRMTVSPLDELPNEGVRVQERHLSGKDDVLVNDDEGSDAEAERLFGDEEMFGGTAVEGVRDGRAERIEGESEQEQPVEAEGQGEEDVAKDARQAARGRGRKGWRRMRYAQKSERRVIRKPHEQTNAQSEEHKLSHSPREDWCEFCTRAKSVASPHRSACPDGETGDVPMAGMDFCFTGQSSYPDLVPIVVVREGSVGEVNVHGLESKGVNNTLADRGQGTYIVKCALTDVENIGYKRFILDLSSPIFAIDLQHLAFSIANPWGHSLLAILEVEVADDKLDLSGTRHPGHPFVLPLDDPVEEGSGLLQVRGCAQDLNLNLELLLESV